MTRSTCALGFLVAAIVAALCPAPASADPPPEPYRIATGLDGYLSTDSLALGDRIFWLLHGNSGTGSQDSELWTSDGTTSGTREFFDPNPAGMGRVSSLHRFGGGFLFTAVDGVHGQEVWFSDGTVPGTHMVADLSQVGSSYILDAGASAAYFSADDGVHGHELYRWTGPGSTPQLLDINTTARDAPDPELEHDWRVEWTSSHPDGLGMVGDTLLFTADRTIRTAALSEWGDLYVEESGTGRELWRVGPTGAPALVKDITATNVWGEPDPRGSTDFSWMTGTAVMDGALYFLTEGTDADLAGPELWRSNGTSAGTTQVASLRIAFLEDHWDFEPVVAGGKLFYASWNGDWNGLWATSGSGPGQRVSPIGDAGKPVALGSGVVFALDQAATGRELWHSDGTTLALLADLRPGALGSNPFPLFAWGSDVYFGARATNGRDLFRTDGTTAGTERVHDLPNDPGALSDGPMGFIGGSSLLYFINSPDNDRNVDNELWVFDPDRVVTEKSSTTILRAPATLAYGAGGTVTVTVSGAGGTPTGTVTIRDGTKALATLDLVNGRATFTLPKQLAWGTHTLRATYAGSAAYQPSVSAPVKVVVKATTKLTARVPDLTFGAKQKIKVTARLTTKPAIKATGRLILLVNGKKRVSAQLAARHGNRLVLTSAPLKVGQHRLQVTFSNSPNAMNATTGIARIRVVK